MSPLLLKLRIFTKEICDSFSKWNVEYINGCDVKQSNLYGILWNLVLIVNKIRPSCMVQPIDYSECCRNSTLKIILSNISSYKYDEKCIFETTEINQGILVYLSRHVSSNKIYKFIKKSIKYYTATYDCVILGNILGYPCSGDVKLPMSAPNRGGICLRTNNDTIIMTNICNSSNKKRFFEKVGIFKQIKNVV